jgi:putative transcriptional regulator
MNGKRMIKSVQEALDFLDGDMSKASMTTVKIPDIDVRAIREETGLSRQEFAATYGFNHRTLESWEQHRKKPNIQARILLKLIQQEAKAVSRVLKSLGYEAPKAIIYPGRPSSMSHGHRNAHL